MHTKTYTVHLEPDEEVGGFTVTVPALPGCVTEGDTYEDALANAREAILCYLEGCMKGGRPVPEEPEQPHEIGVQVDLAHAI